MNRKEIAYINDLTEYPFLAAHQELFSKARKITHPHVVGVVDSYASCLKTLEQLVLHPHEEPIAKLSSGRVEAYNVCRKAVESLVNAGERGDTLNALSRAFLSSIYRLPLSELRSTLNASEVIASQISRDELDRYNLCDRVERFIYLNKAYSESREAVFHNRKIRKSAALVDARRTCSILYKCIQDLARVFARQGDASCQEFVAWLKKD